MGLVALSSCGTTQESKFYRPYSGKGSREYQASGIASWYGHPFHGRRTASGERYDMNQMTCAHKTLPFGAMLKVTNLRNSKTIVVKVNDRGPFIRGRIIDLSREAAKRLAFKNSGIARVRIEWINDPLDHPNIPERPALAAQNETAPAPHEPDVIAGIIEKESPQP
jgi:rare lipoprotein A